MVLIRPLRTDQHFEGFIWRAEHKVIGGDSGCPDVPASLSVKGRVTVGCARENAREHVAQLVSEISH
jgi:hypothetical protein